MRSRTRRGVAVTLGAALLGGALVAAPASAFADEQPLISTDTTEWRYLDTGVDPSGEGEDLFVWAEPRFDDSAWPSATGSFGSERGAHVDPMHGYKVHNHLTQYYGEGDRAGDNIEAYFFRTTIDVDAKALEDAGGIVGTIHVDDAAKIFINGEEVAGVADDRFDYEADTNMQYVGGNLRPPVVQHLELEPDVLVAGENTVAVSVYNTNRTSSDIYFEIENLALDDGALPSLEPGQYISSDATEWRYNDRDEDPAGDGELFSWTLAEYDDSDWPVERAPFGALRGEQVPVSGQPVRTLLTQYKEGTTTNIETFFFRTEIDLTAEEVAEISRLTGTIRHDDALAMWVNGEKVGGFLDDDFDPALGNMQYLGASRGAPIVSTVVVPGDLLEEGANQVSIALYQDRASSSDIYFDFETLDMVSIHEPLELSDLVLNIGTNETERNVAWYYNDIADGEVQWAPASQYDGETFPADAATASSVDTGQTHDGRFYHHATIDELEENESYVYRVGGVRGWSEVYEFSTGEFGDSDVEFFMIGDPQIGSSNNVQRDTEGWVNTLNVAEEMFPEAEFIHSVGDQVERAGAENEYVGFLTPDQLRTMPLATINGNHDNGTTAYETHFHMPNLDKDYGNDGISTRSNGNYWYIYKDILFIGLNSNVMNVDTHEAYVEKIIAEQGDNARWTVASFHHSIFSVAHHSINQNIVGLRNGLSPVLSEHGVDVVLMGHDHSYSRSRVMDGRTPVEEWDGEREVHPDEGQTVYVTGNSSSGSKYYNIRSDEQIDNADPNGFDYLETAWQEYVPSFSHIEVTGDVMTIASYRTDDGSAFDEVVVHRAGADEEPTDPGTDPTDPGTDPGTDPTDPGTDPTDPGTEPTDPTDPGTDPTDPGTEPTDPGTDPTDPIEPGEQPLEVSAEDLVAELEDAIQIAGGDLVAGGDVTVTVGEQYAGQRVHGYLFSDLVHLGASVVAADGTVVFTVPADVEPGDHRLAVYTEDGELIGWAAVTVAGGVAGESAAGDLAVTGVEVMGLAAAALFLLIAGALVLVAIRRRQPAAE